MLRAACARGLAWVCASSLILATSGCVQRRLTIRSNPPGALVYVDNYEIGTTPVSTDYIYYGTRRIRLVKDGFATLDIKQWIPPPWYEIVPIEFASENLVPAEIRDHRVLEFQLVPQMIVPTEQLLGRAENLRQGSKTEGYVPPPQIMQPAGVVPPPWLPAISGAGGTTPPPAITVPPPTVPPATELLPGMMMGPANGLPAPGTGS
jgi:hypothetical protein